MNQEIKKALDFAVMAHNGQTRKCSNIPYIVHPIGVGLLLMNNRESDCVIMAGFLHDILEDTDFAEEDLRINFGEEVLRLVLEASEPEHNNKSWEDRKIHTIENLENISENGIKVVIADKIDNLKSMNNDYFIMGESLWEKFNAPKDKQKWYYSEMRKIFEKRFSPENMLLRSFQDLFRIFE